MKARLTGLNHEEDEVLRARYERLRCEGMQRKMSRELTVFLAEGMCAWMKAWSSLPHPTVDGFDNGRERYSNMVKSEERGFSPPRTGSSTGIRSEMVNILAAMSLRQLGEVGYERHRATEGEC